ncbi:MAG: p21-activated protein kinase-interacting protein 1-like protein [Vezdaea aestivalis]|nr:MAG: p21-activated protein kinase-interacting protein 1-like protein [Vezdaea aestivalis]
MAKRKRLTTTIDSSLPPPKRKSTISSPPSQTIHLALGTYNRVLQGLNLAFNPLSTPPLTFQTVYLFNAHASSIRCLALSPPAGQGPARKRLLATGGSDERINLFSLGTQRPSLPPSTTSTLLPPLSSKNASHPANKALGTLTPHTAPITHLSFPTSSKLLSAGQDNRLALTRARDWTTLVTLKAPVPTAKGRPAGDTAAAGQGPSGVNAVAVHPSGRLGVSVGQAERCVRLWDLVRGVKAGVLAFERRVLARLGEGKWGGEGRGVAWGGEGEWWVGFDRGGIVFGEDCKPRWLVQPTPRTKVHKSRYITIPNPTKPSSDVISTTEPPTISVLALSTEDGRVLLYNTAQLPPNSGTDEPEPLLDPMYVLNTHGPRIKDFVYLEDATPPVFVTAGSEGGLQAWMLDLSQQGQVTNGTVIENGVTKESEVDGEDGASRRDFGVGVLMGEFDVGRRITCLEGFVMDDGDEEGDEDEDGSGEDDIDEDDLSGAEDEEGGESPSETSGEYHDAKEGGEEEWHGFSEREYP